MSETTTGAIQDEEPLTIGRRFYEWKVAHATAPWAPWDRLSRWEQEREQVTAMARAEQCWAVEHPDAGELPSADVLAAYAIVSVDRWARWA